MFNFHKSRYTFARTGLLSMVFVTLLLNMLLFSRVAAAAPAVTIIGQVISCTNISVTYSVSGTTQAATAYITAYNSSGSIGYAVGAGAPGEYTVPIADMMPQPAGTPLYVVASVGSASAQSAPTPCSGGGSGGPPPNSGPVGWSGYGDGRLNPNPAEYYSVWCKANLIEVYRAVPQAVLLAKISLAAVIALDKSGGSLNASNGLKVTRHNDSVTISGSNGNKAPASGAKSFLLSDCIGRNGGAPPSAPPSAKPPAAAATAPATVAATAPATDPCDPYSPTATGTPTGPSSQACFAAHPCVWDPGSIDCGSSYPCRIDSNSFDCRLWQSWDCCFGWALVMGPPFAFPFVLRSRLRRKAGRSKHFLNGIALNDDANHNRSL